jgi:large subunit ribosomal protein L7/L12
MAEQHYDVVLTDARAERVRLIDKLMRVCGYSQAEAREIVLGLPRTVKTGVSRDNAEHIKRELEDAGGRVDIRPATH